VCLVLWEFFCFVLFWRFLCVFFCFYVLKIEDWSSFVKGKENYCFGLERGHTKYIDIPQINQTKKGLKRQNWRLTQKKTWKIWRKVIVSKRIWFFVLFLCFYVLWLFYCFVLLFCFYVVLCFYGFLCFVFMYFFGCLCCFMFDGFLCFMYCFVNARQQEISVDAKQRSLWYKIMKIEDKEKRRRRRVAQYWGLWRAEVGCQLYKALNTSQPTKKQTSSLKYAFINERKETWGTDGTQHR